MIELQFIEREGEAPSEPIPRTTRQSAGRARRREGEAPSEPISRMARQSAGYAMPREGEAPSEPISRMARQSAGLSKPRGVATWPPERNPRMVSESTRCTPQSSSSRFVPRIEIPGSRPPRITRHCVQFGAKRPPGWWGAMFSCQTTFTFSPPRDDWKSRSIIGCDTGNLNSAERVTALGKSGKRIIGILDCAPVRVTTKNGFMSGRIQSEPDLSSDFRIGRIKVN
jgi:hypothetical protein